MLEELRAASNILNGALDQYLSACTSVREYCHKGDSHLSEEGVNLIANELLLINAYKTKFQQADATMNLVRNALSTASPINALPGEMLSRIFYFLTYGEPCKFHQTYEYPTYPTLLTRVCSRWRRIALSSPALWSHIDISTHGFRGSFQRHERHLAHAKSYLARVGHTHLDIHIAEYPPYSFYLGDLGVLDFLTLLAARMRSLAIHVDLDIVEDDPDVCSYGDDLCDAILSSCLVYCNPGILKDLTIIPKAGDAAAFFQAKGTPDKSGGDRSPRYTIEVDMQERDFEDLLSSVTRLNLTGRFPPWSSKAFHGLTELRLHQAILTIHIPDYQFVAILAASPQLDILHFGLDILASASRPSPVPLKNLRTLIVDTTHPNDFLPLIDPGPRPIIVSLRNPQYMTSRDDVLEEHSAIRQLVSRWNITEFCARGFRSLETICRLVELMPSVKMLVLTAPVPPDDWETPIRSLKQLNSRISLDTLCLVTSQRLSIGYSELMVMIEGYHVKKLVLGQEYSIMDMRDTIPPTRLQAELRQLGVAVEFYSPADCHPMERFGHDFM